MITLTGLGVGAIVDRILLPAGADGDFGSLYLAIGSAIATMLVLALTLSLIPLQRASEKLTPSVLTIYMQDARTVFMLGALALLAMLCFTASLEPFGSYHRALLFPNIVAFAASVDLLRWYHRHAAILLQPRNAVETLSARAIRHVRTLARRVTLIARLYRWGLPPGQRSSTSVADLETVVYQRLQGHTRGLERWCDELREIANRAIQAAETDNAVWAVTKLLEILDAYLLRRQSNLLPTLTSAPFVRSSDAHDFIEVILEHIRTICRAAISRNDDVVLFHLLACLRRSTIRLCSLENPRFQIGGLAATAWQITGSYNVCIEMAHEAALDGVVYDAAGKIPEIAKALPEEVRVEDVHLVLINRCIDDGERFLARQRPELADKPIESALQIVRHLIITRHFQWDTALRHLLRRLEPLTQVAAVIRSKHDTYGLFPPLKAAYGAAETASLARLVETAGRLVKDDPERSSRDFRDLVEMLATHFRRLSDRTIFGDSPILREIVMTIRTICILCIDVLDILGQPGIADLLEQVRWHPPCLWVIATQAKQLQPGTANQLADALGRIGLSYLASGYPQMARDMVDHIASIVRAFRSKGDHVTVYEVRNLLDQILYIQALARHKSATMVEARCESALSSFCTCTDDFEKDLARLLEEEKASLEHELQGTDPSSSFGHSPFDNRALLQRLVAAGTA